ncbi:MAG TPA: tetratricopeptide repeat protein [bacterium]|nr:tetratricopeptide repeat protein [bacterium]
MSEDKAMIVKMAFLYVQGGEWYKAIEEYKKLLAMDPEDAHVHNMMGDAYAKKKDDVDALQSYLRSKEIYERQGQTNKIANIDKKIGKLSTDRMDIKQKQYFLSITKTLEADRLAAEGRLEEAIAFFHQLIAAEPINFSYREKLSNLLLENAMVSEAAAQLRAIAEAHLGEGRLEPAQAYAGKLSLIDPDGLDTHRLLGTLAKRTGQEETSLHHHSRLAQLALEAGLYEEAQRAAQEVLASQPGRSDLKLILAKAFLGQKKNTEAKQQLESLLKDNPGDDALVEQLLAMSEEAKDWAGALNHVQALLAKRPDDPKLKPRLARALLQTGKRPEALQVYQGLALGALAENRVEAAMSYFDSILALDPENTEVLKKKGEIYLKLNKKQELIDTYKKLQTVYTNKKMIEEAKKVGLVLTRLAGMK